jgi:CheY-like chemotaxis protein
VPDALPKDKMKNTVIGVFVDDKIEQAIYERTFRKLEHKVDGYVFNNPEDGISVACEIDFDVVFIEIHFWGENFGGISILEQLRKSSRKNMMGIAITSLLQEGDLERIIGSGFTMCIEKPVAFETFEIFCGQTCAN